MFQSLQPHRVAILTAALATLVVLPPMMDPINLPKLWILVFCTSVSVSAFLYSRVKVVLGDNRIVFVVCGTFLFSLLMAGFFSNTSLHRTLFGVWGRNNGLLTYVCFLILYLIVSLQNSDLPSKFLLKSLVVLGIILGAYGFFQLIGIDPIPWENPNHELLLTLGNSNFGSSLLATTSLATLIYALDDVHSKQTRFLLAANFLFQFGIIINARPIQGIIMVLVGSFVFFGITLSCSQSPKFRMISFYWWGIQLILGLCAVLALFNKGPMQILLAANLGSLKDRYYHWLAAINMFQENILFGVGLDSFGDKYRLYREIEAIQSRGTAMFGTNNAHNTFLQLGATGGIFLSITYFALILYTGRRSIIALKKSPDKKLVGGLITIWLVLQLQSLISIDQIGVAVWSWVVGGCLVGISKLNIQPKLKQNYIQIATKDKKRKPVAFITPLLLGGVMSIALLPTVVNDLNIRQKVIQLVNSTDSASAFDNANTLYSEASKSPDPALRIIAIEYLLGVEANDLAIGLAKINAQKFPNSFEAWHALAATYEKVGQKQDAIEARKVSIELDPLNQEIKELLEKDLQPN